MENQGFNQELLDYLYDEMNSAQRIDFETRLKEDKELQNEYNELVSVKEQLDALKDKEVMEPFSTWGTSKNKQWFQPSERKRFVVFRPIAAIAASILILLLAGFLTDFTVSVNSQGFYLGFGTASDAVENPLSKEDVLALVEQEVKHSNQQLMAQLDSVEDNYKNRLIDFESTLANIKNENQQSIASKDDLKAFLSRAENNNTEMIKEYLKATSHQQQVYFKEMFTQFNNFYNQQRETDLAIIEGSLLEINQQQVMQKQETDKALVSLYTAVKKTN